MLKKSYPSRLFRNAESFHPKALLCSLSLLAMAEVSSAGLLLTVSNAGTPREVSATSSATWNFNWLGGSSFTFTSAEFALKKDNLATDGVTFSLWSGYGGAGGSNTLVRTVFVAAADIATSYGATETFPFSEATLANGPYSVQLTSAAASAKSFAVKTGAFKLMDGATELAATNYNTDGNTTGTSTTTSTASIAAVPEPSDFLLGGVPALFGGLALMRRRVARRNGSSVA